MVGKPRKKRGVLEQTGGYLAPRGNQQILEGIALTGQGWVRNMKHETEGQFGDAKDKTFAELFKMIEPRIYELDGPGGTPAPKDVDYYDAERRSLIDDSEIPNYSVPKEPYKPGPK